MHFSVVTATLAGLAVASPMLQTRQTGVNIVDETLQVVNDAGETIVSSLTDISTYYNPPWSNGI